MKKETPLSEKNLIVEITRKVPYFVITAVGLTIVYNLWTFQHINYPEWFRYTSSSLLLFGIITSNISIFFRNKGNRK